MRLRVGSGFDAHRLVAGRRLVLGGVEVPAEAGLSGHSDGDALLHALCDALYGAVGAGDLGQHFPSSDPALRDADSAAFVGHALAGVHARGYRLQNVDATVVAERPRLAPHLAAMRARIAALLEIPEDDVSVKAKSTDGLGALGRGEGVAAFATVLLVGEETT